jgi:hypothetical protein
MVRHGQVAPRICVRPGPVTTILPASELLQEPVNRLDFISPGPEPSSPECRVRDHRPDWPADVELHSEAAKQIINLGRVVTATAETDIPDLVSVHYRSQALVQ